MMKARVLIVGRSPYGDYKAGDRGTVDGYCPGGDGTPCAVVIIGTRFVLVPVYSLKFEEWEEIQ